jgi:hypothetical protein
MKILLATNSIKMIEADTFMHKGFKGNTSLSHNPLPMR